MTRPGPPKQCECLTCVADRRAVKEAKLVTFNHPGVTIIAPAAETAVRDYFIRAGKLVEDLTDSNDIADLSQADTFCCVALVAHMIQAEEHHEH